MGSIVFTAWGGGNIAESHSNHKLGGLKMLRIER